MRNLKLVIASVIAGGAVLSSAALSNTARAVADGQSATGTEEPEPTSYAVGHRVGSETRAGLKNDGMGVDLDLIAKGFADALSGMKPAVPRGEMKEIRAAVHREMEDRRVQRLLADSPEFKKLHDDNLERGRKFCDLFAKQDGVEVLPSGAQYLVIKKGTSRAPGPNDAVRVKVRTQLLDRTVIDDGNTPFELDVSDTIPGGTEILQLMGVGGQWQVVLPPDLAYGGGGRFPDIGPNETMVLTVNLLEITRRGAKAN